MKLHAVALLGSALLFGGCAESVEYEQGGLPQADAGGTADSSSGRDTEPPVDTGSPDTGSVDYDTGSDEDTGSIADSDEFPDYGGVDDGGGGLDSGGATDGGGSGVPCTKDEECAGPSACCDTTVGMCGAEIIPGLLCLAI